MLNKIAEKAKELGFEVVDDFIVDRNEQVLVLSIIVKLEFLHLQIYDMLDVYIDTVKDYKLSNEDLYHMEKLGKLMYYIRELRIDKLLKQ